jgi:putative transposase
MADLKEAESQQADGAVAAAPEKPKKEVKTPKTTKPKARAASAPRARPGKSGKGSPAATSVASPVISSSVRRNYSKQERAQKLGEIQKLVSVGESVKTATKKVGISEQTYYQWKKPAEKKAQGSEFVDLLKLEAENTRLKKLLAERLQKENAELKKRLAAS